MDAGSGAIVAGADAVNGAIAAGAAAVDGAIAAGAGAVDGAIAAGAGAIKDAAAAIPDVPDTPSPPSFGGGFRRRLKSKTRDLANDYLKTLLPKDCKGKDKCVFTAT